MHDPSEVTREALSLQILPWARIRNDGPAAEGEQEEQRISTKIKGELHPILKSFQRLVPMGLDMLYGKVLGASETPESFKGPFGVSYMEGQATGQHSLAGSPPT